ncbi:MAG: EamA family transporter [Gammaproteobacteria bacterium]|nr:EamA family transporter [Gammaproteobacteria bacterium]
MSIAVILSALAAVSIFGASPVAAKLGLQGFTALELSILRTVIAGFVTLPLVFFTKIALPEGQQQKLLLIISAFCGFIGFPVLFTFGMELTSANHASIILASLPIFTTAIALIWDKRRPGTFWIIGCTIALLGEYLLITGFTNTKGPSNTVGDLLVLASNVFASLGYVAGGRLQRQSYSARNTTFIGVAICAVFLLPVLFFITDWQILQTASPGAWFALLYIAIGVTIIGYVLWYWALGTGGIAKVGLFQFLQPVSGVILASVLLHESLNLAFFVASSLVLSGVWIALKQK